jgi:hypothetical protein
VRAEVDIKGKGATLRPPPGVEGKALVRGSLKVKNECLKNAKYE